MASKGSPINYIGVDVGTRSVRAGLFSSEGKLLAYNTCDIKLWTNEGFHEGSFEQSTSNIWTALCTTIQTVIKGVDPNSIKGIGFDATCSLVVVDTHGNPVTVSPSHDPERNIILWQDHRAIQEANEINELGHPLLKYVGGMISPEMEPPKLLWLKRHLNEVCWSKAGHFLDLADYLVYRATNTPTRSLCTLVCKWGYIGHTPDDVNLQQGWNDSFWKQIGLEEFVNDKYNKIGTIVQAPGLPVGTGLSPRAAREFGLEVGTPVATALIDAHAGGLGMVGTDPSKVLPSLGQVPLSSRLALIAGTSSCHMATSNTPIFVPGVWGPYYSAMIPGTYLNEGGQSSSGSLLDSIIKCNSDLFLEVKERGRLRGIDVYKELEIILTSLTKERFLSHLSLLTTDFHILPDFHGNRSPLADPTLKGMIFGLSLTQSVHELAVMYLAAIQALAYNTRHIIETMIKHGHNFKSMFICGGLSHNHLFVQTHADITGMPVILTQEKEAVLLGAAILAATAAGEEIESVMMKMTHITSSSIVQPTDNPTLIEFHNKKYRVFQALYKDQYKYRKIMSDNLTDIKF